MPVMQVIQEIMMTVRLRETKGPGLESVVSVSVGIGAEARSVLSPCGDIMAGGEIGRGAIVAVFRRNIRANNAKLPFKVGYLRCDFLVSVMRQ